MSFVYQIKLTPNGSFYFGGEGSFSSPKIDSISKDKNSIDYFKPRQGYFAKSEKFPQQTQLLGMVKKELLKANGLLMHFKHEEKPIKDNKVKEIIGDKWGKEVTNTGVIKELSPLFLWHKANEELCFPMPYDYGYVLETTSTAYINGIKKEAVAFKSLKDSSKYFSAKDYLYNNYHTTRGFVANIDEIFTPYIQTHTQTIIYKKDDEEQLFKVERYVLNENFDFVFYLTLSDKYFEDNYNTTVFLGGENSSFNMSVELIEKLPLEDINSYYNLALPKDKKIVLLSDSYIDAEDNIFEYAKASMCDKTQLRTIVKNREHFNKTTKLILLTKGSVFYPKSEEARKKIESILNKESFQKIGYNKYITLKGE